MEEDRQMKSSSSKQPTAQSFSYPKMSVSMFELLCQIRDLPAFFGIVYLDNSGNMQFWSELTTDFPKDKVLPGLARIANKFKLEFLDNFKDAPDQTEMNEFIQHLAEEGQDDIRRPILKIMGREPDAESESD